MDKCFLGSSIVQLKFVEVIPLSLDVNRLHKSNALYDTTALSSAFIKIHLQKLTQNASLLKGIVDDDINNGRVRIQWSRTEEENEETIETNGKGRDDGRYGYKLQSGILIWNCNSDSGSSNPNNIIEKDTAPTTNSAQKDDSNRQNNNFFKNFPIIYLPSPHPVDSEPRPCCIIGHALRRCLTRSKRILKNQSTDTSSSEVIVTDDTLVRVLPQLREFSQQQIPTKITSAVDLYSYMNDDFTGEIASSYLLEEMDTELINNHNPETIQELSLRMSLLMTEPVYIGTTANAMMLKRRQQQRSYSIQQAIHTYCTYNDSRGPKKRSDPRKVEEEREIAENNCATLEQASQGCVKAQVRHSVTPSTYKKNDFPSIIRQGALIVHSPHHGAGKTSLVRMIAKRYLNCSAIHVIQPGPLLAKYGVHADAALESILHAITMSAAVKAREKMESTRIDNSNNSICIILDHLDAMLPPRLSGRSSGGDSAVPVLNGIASYLKMLTLSIRRTKEFPFPSKNPLYNVGGVDNSGVGNGGDVLPVRICLVAIVTCPDDGWQGGKSASNSNAATILDGSLAASRYRLPTLTATTRLKAFQFSFDKQKISLPPSARSQLPILAASAVWARGSAFSSVGEKLRIRLLSRCRNDGQNIILLPGVEKPEASLQDLKMALSSVARDLQGNTSASSVSFLAGNSSRQTNDTNTNTDIVSADDAYVSVGGNSEAKKSLDDALALDPTKRTMLSYLGWAPPTGVLLYGPPGCGKTLLAKAVARLLRSGNSSGGGNYQQQHDDLSSSSSLGGAFISLNSSEIVHGEVGTSEKLVRSAFETARMNAPSVIFIDEFQALFTARSGGGSGKLSSTLLQCMDDVKLWRDANSEVSAATQKRQPAIKNSSSSSSTPVDDQFTILDNINSNDDVVVLGATNTPWMIDKAFLRPGRFDRLVHVGLPTLQERESILRVHLRKMNILCDGSNDTGLLLETMCQKIANETHGFSGADLASLCRAAAVRCLMEDEEELSSSSSLPTVKEKHFLEEINQGKFQPSSNHNLVQRNFVWQP